MKGFFEEWGVTICGAITSLLTALLVLLIEKVAHFDIFTFSHWVIIPTGAIATGLAAASGYYLSSVFFNHRPTKRLLLNMVFVAAGTHFLIYFLQYSTLSFEDGTKVSDAVSFTAYLDVVLTKAKYGLVRAGTHGGVEVGSFGYFLGVLQFIGFMFGGFAMWAILAAKPYCEKCNKYFAKTVKKDHQFIGTEAFTGFYDKICKANNFERDYLTLIKENNKSTVEKGPVLFSIELMTCPGCFTQAIYEITKVFNGKEWSDVAKLSRNFKVPDQFTVDRDFNFKEKQKVA